MKLLVDTQLLLWAAGEPHKLSASARERLEHADNELLFSVASIWEIVIKRGLGRADFVVDPRRLWRGLVDNGYAELDVRALHALAVERLPALHKDPFDRMLLAQTEAEGLTLLTADPTLARYPVSVVLV